MNNENNSNDNLSNVSNTELSNQNLNSSSEVNNVLVSDMHVDSQDIVMPGFNIASNNESTIQVNSTEQVNSHNNNNQILYDTTNHINDKPIIQKKTKKASIKINQELKTAIVLALILFIFILIMPSILDLFY